MTTPANHTDPTATSPASGGDAWYWRLRRRMTPGLRNAQYAYFEALDATLREGDRWLDLGCGRRLVPVWMRKHDEAARRLLGRAGRAVGVDPDAEALADNTLPIIRHHATAERVPEPAAGFDLITANMVVEHLEDPAAVLREAARLLRPGGRLLMHTPNRWYPVTAAACCVPGPIRRRITGWLEKRPAREIYPTHYRLNRVGTIHKLARQAGLAVESITLTADSPETIRLGPLVAAELALIALTRTRPMRGLRSNLIVTLSRPIHLEEEQGRMAMPRRLVLGREAFGFPRLLGDAA